MNNHFMIHQQDRWVKSTHWRCSIWLIALISGDMQSFLHLHHCGSLLNCCRAACVYACAYVVGCVGSCTRHVSCTPVPTRIYIVTGVFDTRVYTCNHTRRRVYICTYAYAFPLFVLSNFSTTCVCTTRVFEHLHAVVAWEGGSWTRKRGLF